jgi:hypothetical protein
MSVMSGFSAVRAPARPAREAGAFRRLVGWQSARAFRGRLLTALVGVSAILNVVAVIGNGTTQARDYRQHTTTAIHATNALVQMGFASLLFATVAGALLPLIDFRDRSVGRSVLVSRGVRPLVSAQLVASLPIGLLFGLIGAGSSTITASLVARANHIPFVVNRSVVLSIVGVALVSLLAAPWGVLLGWIGRRLTITLAAIVLWILVAEGALNAVVPALWKWLPDGAQAGIYRDVTTSHVDMAAGVGLFLGWVAVAVAACWARRRHSDLL